MAAQLKTLDVKNVFEHPFLFFMDMRIYTTLCGLVLVFYIYRHVLKKSIYPFTENDIGSFSWWLQGILMSKYIFLINCHLFFPKGLEYASNTILFSHKIYIIMAVVDFLIFWHITRLPSRIKHSLRVKGYSMLFFYYVLYNLLSFLKIDVYYYQFDLRSSSIILFGLTVIVMFFSENFCREINEFVNRDPENSNKANQ